MNETYISVIDEECTADICWIHKHESYERDHQKAAWTHCYDHDCREHKWAKRATGIWLKGPQDFEITARQTSKHQEEYWGYCKKP